MTSLAANPSPIGAVKAIPLWVLSGSEHTPQTAEHFAEHLRPKSVKITVPLAEMQSCHNASSGVTEPPSTLTQNDTVASGNDAKLRQTLKLKIRVSAVQFRPWPPSFQSVSVFKIATFSAAEHLPHIWGAA
jgi:hypothetical protein